MLNWRLLALAPAVLGVASAALADFDGPTPLAWRWAQSSPVAPSGQPLISGDVLYISVGDKVYALDKTTGNQKWKFPTIETVDGYFHSSPVFADGVVVVNTERTVYGIDPTTGHQKWYYKLEDPEKTISGQPVSADKYAVFKIGEEQLLALNGADGKPSWPNPQPVADRLKGNLAGFNSSVYFFTQTNVLYSMDVAAPKNVKKIITLQTVSEDATPTVHSDLLYINSSSYVAALNAYSGGARWQLDTGQDLVYGPAVSSDAVASVSRDGLVTILDLKGKVKIIRDEAKKTSRPMRIDLGSGPVAAPTNSGAYFVIPTANGVINLVNGDTGEITWRYVVRPMSASQAPAQGQRGTNRPDAALYTVAAAGAASFAGDTMLILADDGSLLAFDKNLGVDATGPEIKMGFPAEGSQVNGQNLQLVFRISDEASGVNESSIKVSVGGQPMDFEYTADGLATVTISPYSKNKVLADGRAPIEVDATDWMGNVTSRKFVLLIDNTLAPIGAPVQPTNPKGGRGGGGAGGGGGGTSGG
jgi:outer membrane protein assembly factor BamB